MPEAVSTMNPSNTSKEETTNLQMLMRTSGEHSVSLAESSFQLRRHLQNLIHIRDSDPGASESLTDKLADATEAYIEAFGEYTLDLARIIDAINADKNTFERKIQRISSDIALEASLRRGERVPSTPTKKPERISFLMKIAASLDGENCEDPEISRLEEETAHELRAHYQENFDTTVSVSHNLANAAMSLIQRQIVAEHSMQPQYFIEKDVA